MDNPVRNPASVNSLFQESEIEADYTIGWVRIAAGFVLLVSSSAVSASRPSRVLASRSPSAGEDIDIRGSTALAEKMDFR
jgi:hypothetical protein